jgi:uncharacterized protein (DUF433 family)
MSPLNLPAFCFWSFQDLNSQFVCSFRVATSVRKCFGRQAQSARAGVFALAAGEGDKRFCAHRGILAQSTLSGYPSRMNYEHLITIEPGKRSGKPCIRGMRITVYDVLEYLASGMTEDEILTDFSELTREDIKACLAFAADRERKLFNADA